MNGLSSFAACRTFTLVLVFVWVDGRVILVQRNVL